MSIETIKQGSGQLAAEQCPGQGAAEEGGYWEICPSGLLAGAVLAVVCTYPVTHPVPGPAHVNLPPSQQLLHRPGHSLHTRWYNVVDIIIEYILYLN